MQASTDDVAWCLIVIVGQDRHDPLAWPASVDWGHNLGDPIDLATFKVGFSTDLGVFILYHRMNEYSCMIAVKGIREWSRFLKAMQTIFPLGSCFSGLADFVRQSQTGLHVMRADVKNQKKIAPGGRGGSLFATAQHFRLFFSQPDAQSQDLEAT